MERRARDLVDPKAAQEVAQRVWANTKPGERAVLLEWLRQLAAIRDSREPSWVRGYQALRCTLSSAAVWPLVKILAKEGKRVGWDERSYKWRAFLGVSGLGFAVFGTQGAGIAALGGAIGVPLWLVLGGGAVVLDALIGDTVRGRKDRD